MTQSSAPFLRIGTRGSPLALWQAREVRAHLAVVHGVEPDAIAIEVIRTTGDIIQDRPLSEVGGKGLFTKEIEQALVDKAIDLAVHSCKDMPTVLPAGLKLAACLPREDARDALISRKSTSLTGLPHGAVIGTASLRRQAMVKRLRPDVSVVAFSVNMNTRLKKLDSGVLEVDAFLPAVGQGAIGIEVREADTRTCDLLVGVNHPDTLTALCAERAFLGVLDGSCRTPVAGHARINGGTILFRGLILRPDGSEAH